MIMTVKRLLNLVQVYVQQVHPNTVLVRHIDKQRRQTYYII